jgi:hypothetical protein
LAFFFPCFGQEMVCLDYIAFKANDPIRNITICYQVWNQV